MNLSFAEGRLRLGSSGEACRRERQRRRAKKIWFTLRTLRNAEDAEEIFFYSRHPPRFSASSAVQFFLAVAVLLLTPASISAAAVAPDGASEGKGVYAQFCATCHGSVLRGGGSPPLVGSTFLAKWTGRPAEDLYQLIADTMPKGATGTLTTAQTRQVFEYVLAANGFRPDSKVLTRDPNAKVEAEPPEPVLPKLMRSALHPTAPGPTDADLAAAADGSWLTYNRDYQGRRFANLAQITPDNVKRLAPVCIFQPGEPGSFEASPIIDGDRLYVTTTHNTYAMNAATCRKLWQYDYVPPGAEGLPVNRGVALYQGKVLRGTADGHVIALDAANGMLLWDVWVANAARGYNINGAPAVFGSKVIVGEGGADRGATGHIYAFDVDTGVLAWSFDTVPTGTQPGAETWGNGSAVGGGSSWTAFTIDPADHALYVPVGNPGADMDGSLRPGANLYTDSVVVLDAGTGKLKWYIQQVPHDTHDWDTAAAPVLYDLGGRKFMAVASKDGWLYLYDRDTKALIAKSETTTHLNTDNPMKPGDVLRVCPSTLGGAEWNGPAFDPKPRMVFVNTVDWCGTFRVERSAGSTFGGGLDFDPFDKVSGWVRGFDAATGQEKWRIHAEGPMVAGLTPTASGLVFTGTSTGEFWALSATTGDVLYRFNTGGAIAGGISTYQVNGRQYIAVTSGSASQTIWHSTGAPTLIVFALPAT